MGKVLLFTPRGLPSELRYTLQKIPNRRFAQSILALCSRVSEGNLALRMDDFDITEFVEAQRTQIQTRKRALRLVWVNPNK